MNTSLVKLHAGFYAKLDFENPTGSAKYRPAVYILKGAFEKGLLKEGGTVIEATSGNTGIALASVAKDFKCRAVIVMPDNMSKERIEMIENYGGKVILTPSKDGMHGAVSKALELKEKTPNSFIADQFNNKDNVRSHYETTGPEIWNQTNGKTDVFIAGIGTGGTITGVAKYLKEKNPEIKIIGIEPASSPLLSTGRSGAHKIQGIGADFVPSILDLNLVDEVVEVSDSDALEGTGLLAKNEGIMAGISSGAVYAAAKKITLRPDMENKTVVAFFTDSADRYLSMGLYD